MRSKHLFLAALLALSGGFAATAQDDFSVAALNAAYDRCSPSLCMVSFTQEVLDPRSGETRRRDGNSLGLIVRADGLIMTHGHLVLENADPVDVRVRVGRGADMKEYPAAVLRKPDDVNVVFLQMQSDTPLNLPVVQFRSGSTLRLGEPVAVFGLMGDTLDFEPGLAVVRVNAVLDEPRLTYALDGAMRFGFVNGPVVNTRGEVVGVVGFDLGRNEGGDLYTRSGHPLVYQTDLFRNYIADPPSEETRDSQREEAWLGVFTQPLKAEFAEYWGLENTGGLIVSTVVPDSPAATAGIQSGDIIKAFDGRPMLATQDRDVLGFTKLVRDTGTGATVTIDLLRGGQPLSLEVTLAALPTSAQEAGEYEDNVLGLVVREITRDVRIALNIAEDVKGVIVRRVKSGSPAQLGKMRPGVIVLAIGDHPVETLQDFEEAMDNLRETKPAEVAVFARVGPATGFFRVQPRW